MKFDDRAVFKNGRWIPWHLATPQERRDDLRDEAEYAHCNETPAGQVPDNWRGLSG